MSLEYKNTLVLKYFALRDEHVGRPYYINILCRHDRSTGVPKYKKYTFTMMS